MLHSTCINESFCECVQCYCCWRIEIPDMSSARDRSFYYTIPFLQRIVCLHFFFLFLPVFLLLYDKYLSNLFVLRLYYITPWLFLLLFSFEKQKWDKMSEREKKMQCRIKRVGHACIHDGHLLLYIAKVAISVSRAYISNLILRVFYLYCARVDWHACVYNIDHGKLDFICLCICYPNFRHWILKNWSFLYFPVFLFSIAQQ